MFNSILSAETAPATAAPGFDPMTLILFAIFAVVIFMMFRKQKKAKAAQAEQQAKMAPGVEIMTNFGLFGTVVSVDEENNKVVVELAPGSHATVHRQTIAKITLPEDAAAVVPDDASSLTAEEPSAPAVEAADEPISLNKDNNKDN
ncbi:preprotein translocase subunit YajC [Arthrobacter sp. 35W]|uniref:preprotein translocase subunit YajC n=1 Tax=Arthrobacter sp. 35W TaxID=1132441 RepID=UPI001E36C084|nr:preprotein translocase subunit YajC [Arthrobacter sp. 35W]